MKEIETGIYPTYIPENDAELSRYYDLGGIQKPATIIAGYEQRAIAVLIRHNIVDETFLCDQSPIEPPARKFVVDQHPAIIRTQLVQKREDGTHEPAKAPAVYRVEHPENLKVPLVPPGIEPNTDLEKEQQQAQQRALAVVLDARSLLVQIPIYRHQEQLVERLWKKLAVASSDNEKSQLIDDARHATEILNAHAIKIGELADRLFKGRPSEEPVRFANGVRAKYAENRRESIKARAAKNEELNKAIRMVVKSTIEEYKTETTNHIAVRVRTRLEESDEIKDILSSMDSKIPSLRTLRKKISALRPK